MRWLILFAGGGLGACLRFALALWIDERVQVEFPWGTLAVNALGCLAIGLLATVADEHRVLGPGLRLFLVAGLLGGFTTFSTFGLETWRLFEQDLGLLAVLNAFGSVAICLAGVAIGVILGRELG